MHEEVRIDARIDYSFIICFLRVVAARVPLERERQNILSRYFI